MPEPLGYARGAMTELRARYGELSREELLELVCSLTKEYVLDQTIPFDFPHPERAEAMRGDRPDAPGQATSADEASEASEASEVQFARLISGLKARTQLAQFAGFEVEGGQAVLIVDNQKVVFGEQVTVSLVGRRGPRGSAPSGSRPAPTSTPSAAPTPSTSVRPAPARGAPAQAASPQAAPPQAASARSGGRLPPGPFENRGGGPPEPPRRTLSLDEEPARSPESEVDDYDDSGVERFGGLDLD